ncbi:MAG: hypothetical protein AAGB15_00935 [Pseudomonadota bacterium]
MAALGHSLCDVLVSGRVHEATGLGRHAFAWALAAELSGAVIWVQDAKTAERPYPPGVRDLADPAALIMVQPSGALPVLQAIEEALRAGAASLVVGVLERAPDLTESRRLQLASGTGGGRGLCLVPEDALRSNAAETRWKCTSVPGSRGRQHWEMIKNKRGRLGQWQVDLSPVPSVHGPVVAA